MTTAQVMGTSVGTEVFVRYGWRAAAALSMGWYGFQLFILLLRGPHCERYTWFGYEGGIEPRKDVVDAAQREKEGKQPTIDPGVDANEKESEVKDESMRKDSDPELGREKDPSRNI